PAVDAVQRDDVGIAEIGKRRLQQLIETRFHELDVRQARGFDERSRRDDMGRIEIDADKRHVRIRSGKNQGREAVAATQFAISRPGPAQVGLEAGKEQRRLEMAGGELWVESQRVRNPDVIPLSPVGHRRILNGTLRAPCSREQPAPCRSFCSHACAATSVGNWFSCCGDGADTTPCEPDDPSWLDAMKLARPTAIWLICEAMSLDSAAAVSSLFTSKENVFGIPRTTSFVGG